MVASELMVQRSEIRKKAGFDRWFHDVIHALEVLTAFVIDRLPPEEQEEAFVRFMADVTYMLDLKHPGRFEVRLKQDDEKAENHY